MTDPKQIAETVTALMLEHEALLSRVGVTTSDPEAMVYSEDGKPVRKVKDITSPAKKAADLLQSLASENAALKAEAEAAAARLAEVEAERDEFYSDWDAALKLTNKTAGLMLRMDADRLAQAARAEAAEAERDRLAAELAEARAVLQDIAKQKRTEELDTELEVENADFEGGYDNCISIARAYLTKGTTT